MMTRVGNGNDNNNSSSSTKLSKGNPSKRARGEGREGKSSLENPTLILRRAIVIKWETASRREREEERGDSFFVFAAAA